MNDLPDRELTPTELRQLIESNARSIQANSAANAEQRQNIDALRRTVEANSDAVVELRETLSEGFAAVQADLSQLARFMQQFMQGQSSMNGILDDALEGHEERLRRLEGTNPQ